MNTVLKSYQTNHFDKINSLSSILKNIADIEYFSYQSVKLDQSYCVLTSNPEYYEQYSEGMFYKHDPYLCDPMCYDIGTHTICFPIVLGEELESHSLSTILATAYQYKLFNNMIIINRYTNGYEIFCFGSVQKNPKIFSTLFKESNLLKRFAKYFKAQMNDIICEMHEYKLSIEAIKGDTFITSKETVAELITPSAINQNVRNDIIQMLSPEEHFLTTAVRSLTTREYECLEWMIKGKSAIETSEILQISKRTVDTYREKIRYKFGSTYTPASLGFLLGKYGLISYD